MQDENIMTAIDEELDNCIKKFRNAVYGYEVRTFITEYEELMLKKSDLQRPLQTVQKPGEKPRAMKK